MRRLRGLRRPLVLVLPCRPSVMLIVLHQAGSSEPAFSVAGIALVRLLRKDHRMEEIDRNVSLTNRKYHTNA